MTPLPQIERLAARVVTKVITLPAVAASRQRVASHLAKRPNHCAVNSLIRWGFYVFIFSLLFEWPDRPIPMEIPTLIGFIYIAFTFLQPKVCYRRFPIELGFYVVYLCYFALLCGFVTRQADSIKLFTLMVQIFFLMWSGYNLMRYDRIKKTALATLVISCTALSAMQVLGIATTDSYDYYTGSRSSVLGQNPNNMANNISLGLVALVGFAFGRNKSLFLVKYVAAPLAIIMIGAIFHTGSRGALIAFGVGFAAFAIRGKTLWAKAKSLIMVLAILGGLVLAALQMPSLVLRYTRTIYENNMAGRERIFPAAWDMIKEKPLIGWGPIDYMYELGKRVRIIKDPITHERSGSNKGATDTHNMFLGSLTSTGLFGTVPLFIYVVLCMLAAWRARHGSEGALPLVMVFTVTLINMSGNWIASKLDWLMMTYALASAGSLLAVSLRPPAAMPTSPSRSLPARPALAYANNRRRFDGAGMAINIHQQRGVHVGFDALKSK
jgi:O-antigen ligase